jgi:hypothetical protein
MKSVVKALLQQIRRILFNKYGDQRNFKLVLKDSDYSGENLAITLEIQRRLKYYQLDDSVQIVKKLSILDFFNYRPVAYINSNPNSLLRFKHTHVFKLNHITNYDEGWEYHRILMLLNEEKMVDIRKKSKVKLAVLKRRLASEYDRAYILGTGPSLEKAAEVNWKDGIRIVSNTIVKDADLWNYINPHVIVAGDAIYHFGLSDFAVTFRNDLRKRLKSSETYFIFPEIFWPFVEKELLEFSDLLIPIPTGQEHNITDIIERKFELPGMGNVLNLLLLPLACYLSNCINLWGFDGRSPDAKLFWKNSDKQFYTDMVPQLRSLHPAFFDYLVPDSDPSKYVANVHGDVLESMLIHAESHGKTFNMMHPSYTEVLMTRYRKACTT